MLREGEDFSIHTRPSDRGPVFYVQFRCEDGSWTTAKSTRILDTGKPKDRQAAIATAQHYVDTGQVVRRETVTLETFAKDFFDWQGEWAREKKRYGHRISEDQCRRHQESLDNHVVAAMGTLRLSRLEDLQVRRFQARLEDEGLMGATINRISVALRLLLRAAYEKKLMRRMPVVKAVSERDRKERGTFLPDEIRRLFDHQWPDRRCFVANKTAAGTGLRASELSGLRENKVHPEYLEIERKWSPRYGIGPTKTGRPRIVPIPSLIYAELQSLIQENPNGGSDRFIFYTFNPDRPQNQREFTEALIAEMIKIGIPDDPTWKKEKREPMPGSRQARGLDFHAWRHTFNSLLVDRRIPLQAIQSVTGHLSPEMTQRYYHMGGESGAGIRQIAESIFVERPPETPLKKGKKRPKSIVRRPPKGP